MKRSSAFRPEIEGLRAIAATLVMTFHIWLGRVSGGVDVFFVVSSFLITSSLLGMAERNGKVLFAQFWAGLIRRLMPLAYVVLCVVIIVSVFLLPRSRWLGTMQEVAGAAGYVENWVLAFKSIDYLARTGATSPVQHFWALSTQGQFYLLWPLLFAAALYLSGRLKAAFRRILCYLIVGVFCASFAYSVVLTRIDQPFAYFNSLARAWEFCIGALLALALPHLKLAPPLRVAAGWIGTLAILSCGLIFTVSRAFPGYLALWPTLGAALVIIAGSTGSRWGVDRILSSAPLVFIGGISYGIYLWHFPMLVFLRTLQDPQHVTTLQGLAICVASVALAWASSRWLENPARHSALARDKPSRVFAFGAASLAAVLMCLGGWQLHHEKLRRSEPANILAGDPNYPGAAALAEGFRYQGEADVPVFPGAFQVQKDWDKFHERCNRDRASDEPVPCTGGDPDGSRLIVLVGASHVDQWSMPVEDIARRNGWKLMSFTRNSCPFYWGQELDIHHREDCDRWNAKVMRELVRLQPDLVFTTSTRPGGDGDYIPDGYLKAWETLAAADIEVIAVRDNPDFGFDVSACVELHGAQAAHCKRRRSDVYTDDDLQARVRHLRGHVTLIDLSDYFCDAVNCHPVIGNVMVYRHGAHLTATYAMSLRPMLEARLLPVLSTLNNPVGAD